MKKRTKKATIKTEVRNLNEKETIEHYNAILVEHIRSEMQAVIEGMESTKIYLKKEMHLVEEKLTQEIELVKGVLHDNSSHHELSRVLLNGMSRTIKENSIQIVDLKRNFDSHSQKITNEIRAFGKKTTDDLANSEEKLEEHEARITNLETTRL